LIVITHWIYIEAAVDSRIHRFAYENEPHLHSLIQGRLQVDVLE